MGGIRSRSLRSTRNGIDWRSTRRGSQVRSRLTAGGNRFELSVPRRAGKLTPIARLDAFRLLGQSKGIPEMRPHSASNSS